MLKKSRDKRLVASQETMYSIASDETQATVDKRLHYLTFERKYHFSELVGCS